MSNWTLSMPDGSRVVSTSTSRRFYDRNNNYIELQSVQNYKNTGLPASLLADQFGRSVAMQSISQTETRIHAVGFNDEMVTWRVLWKTIHVRKDYRTVAVTNGQERGNSSTQTLIMSFKVVDRIILPAQAGGQSYVFGYNGNDVETEEESYGWGEVNSVTLPSGAHVAYDYKLDGEGILQSNVNTTRALENSPRAKTISYQAEYDGVSSPVTEAWNYNISRSGSCVTAPDGGATCQDHGDVSYENKSNGLVFTISNPDGSRVERDWQHNYPIGFDPSYSANPYVKSEFISIKDAAGVNFTKTAIKDYNYDKNGNLTRVKEYDWVPYSAVHDAGGAPLWNAARPTVVREKVDTYNSPTPDATDATSSSSNAYYNGSAPLLRSAIASTEVRAGALTSSRSEFSYDSPTTTGNLVETRTWDNTRGPLLNLPGGGRLDASNSISMTNQYDQFGNVTLKTEPGRADGSRSQTRYVYGPVNGHANLYPTEEIVADGTPRARTTRREYDFWTGLVTRTTDADNNVSSATGYDALGRPTLTVAAEGRPEEARAATDYADTLRRVSVRADLNVVGDGKRVSVQHYDQLGRVRLSRRLEDVSTQDAADETTGIKMQTRYAYAGANSYTLTSNPYRGAVSAQASGEPTMGWTVSTADRGGRVVRVETFAGAAPPAPWGANTNATGAVSTVYDAEATTFTDQAGKSRKNVVDALGRLIQTFEAPHEAGYNYQTSYAYDAVDNLGQVQQGGQTRVFQYSSLSRLVSAANPESGTSIYEYDPNGNLKKKTDAHGVTTDYTYDALNRMTFVDYSGTTPDVTYAYDTAPNGVGRLASVSNSVSVYSYGAYDAIGRVRASSQTVGGITYSMPDYQYDLAGNLVSQQYPSGRVMRTEYDEAGRMAGVKNQATGGFYAGAAAGDATNRVQYTAHGAASAVKLGNGLWEHTDFNSRLQPVQIGLGTSGTDSSKLQLDFGYGTTDNNGNVRSQAITVASSLTLSQVYTYDHLNRLDVARETKVSNGSETWKQRFSYDQFGNRAFNAAETTDNVEGPQLSFNAANRITTTGYGYDAAGNLTSTPDDTYQYDAENRMVSLDGGATAYGGAAYFYDGDGRRVKKVMPTETTVFVYNAMGQLIAEYSNQGGDGGTSYLTQDHLGSTRVVTDSSGQPKSRHDYLPFGEEVNPVIVLNSGREGISSYNFGSVRQKFTLKERDIETGLDYFGARYLSSTQARFTSVDPVFITLERLIDPQRLNLYSYAKNNPLRFVDADGMDLAIDAETEEEARRKYELFQKGLTKDDRSHTHFVVGNGKDGYEKGQFYVQIDKDHKSESGNFTAVQTIANDRGGTALITLQKGGENIPEVLAVKQGNKIVLEDPSKHFGENLPNTLGLQAEGDTTYGTTMYPVPKQPIEGQTYGTGKNIGVHVWNEQSDVEIVATMYHELRAHVYLSNMGRDIPKGSHGAPGVNDAAKAAEVEAKKNFKQ